MGMIPHPIRPEIEGDEKRFEADLLDMVARPNAWRVSAEQAKDIYKRMSVAKPVETPVMAGAPSSDGRLSPGPDKRRRASSKSKKGK